MALPFMGGNLAPNQPAPNVPPATAGAAPNYNSLQYRMAPTASPFAGRNYNELVSNSLEHFMNPNSDLMQNAAQRGIEYAASRGGLNSSIAAGAAQREVLEGAGNLAQGAVAGQLQQESAQLDNWLSEQGFNRQLAAKPYESSLNMLNAVSQMSLMDPQLFPPSVVSGFSNFFNQNMNDMLKNYFGGGNG